jgi:mono/diheme cytochrome c family protein
MSLMASRERKRPEEWLASSGRSRSRLATLLVLLLSTGCQQEMARQPSQRPLQASSFFDDGRASRPLVYGTVAHSFEGDGGSVREDRHLYEGLKTVAPEDVAKLTAALGTPGQPASLGTLISWLPYAESFPMGLSAQVLERGKERYDIYCAVCHDRAGNGNGMIAQRGFTRPPNFHNDESRGLRLKGIKISLRDAPVGYYFQVITHGFGAMPKYSAQVPPRDRWAIIAYVRALQVSHHLELAALPADLRDSLNARAEEPR